MKGKFRYWVSYFCELNVPSDGFTTRGHFRTKVYEISHPLNTEDEVKHFVDYLQQKEGKMYKLHLLAFSLMYFKEGD